MKPTPPRQPNQSLIDGLKCLQAVALKGRAVKAAEIGRELGMESTRVHRLLKTLAYIGFTQQNDQRRYSAGPGVMVLAAQTLHASSVMREALVPLEKLRSEIGHMVAMGAVWNRDISYLYHAGPNSSLEEALGVRTAWAAANSGIGWAVLCEQDEEEIRELYHEKNLGGFEGSMEEFLAGLKQSRKQGYAAMKVGGTAGNITIGIRLKYNPYVAIGISGQISEKEQPRFVEKLRATVQQIEDRHKELT